VTEGLLKWQVELIAGHKIVFHIEGRNPANPIFMLGGALTADEF
jgi:hypothetical protein